MPFTVEEFYDLVRILEERPEWRAELRRLVLTEELLSLPEQVARLTEAQRRTEEQVARLTEAQRRTEEQVASLTEQVASLTEQVTRLTEAQRRTEEQVASLTEQVARLTEVQRRIEEQVASLTEQVAGLTRAVHLLTDEVGELKGESLERRYRERAPLYLSRWVRRAHVLSTEELLFLLEGAVERGELSEAEEDEVGLADLVIRGKLREDGREIFLVLEVSWGVGPEDVERAVRRAALLAKTGISALPMVAGKWLTKEVTDLARGKKVWQLIEGRVVLPEPAPDDA